MEIGREKAGIKKEQLNTAVTAMMKVAMRQGTPDERVAMAERGEKLRVLAFDLENPRTLQAILRNGSAPEKIRNFVRRILMPSREQSAACATGN